ncbi:MAG: polysaccharide biosynthesis C-terminal domain-containing protein [Crocinitomicaceae bacterium]
MKRKFLSGLFLIVLLNLLVKPFYLLGIDAEVQNRVGEEVYGNYFALLNFTFLLNILLDAGITNFNTRNIAQSPQLLQKHFFSILSLRLGLFLPYAAFTLISGFIVGYSPFEFYLLSILIINQFLVATIQYARSNFGGLHLFKTDAFISVLDRSLLIIFCAILLWTNLFEGPFQIEWFVYAQTIAYAITALLSVGILGSKVGRIQIGIKKNFSVAILKQSFPYALLIFLMMMYNRVDAVMIERLLPDGNKQAGMYAQGFRFLDAVNMFALLFAGLLLPIFSRLIKEKQNFQEMMQLAYRLLAGISIIVGITCFGFKEELIDLRYPQASEASPLIFGWLILSFIPISLTYVFGTLLTANGSLRALNKMAIFGVALNVVLNYILIRKFQAEGAAVATLITQSITAFIQIVLVYQIFKFKINYKAVFSLSALAVIMIAATYGWRVMEIHLHSLLALLSLIALGILTAFVLRIFRISDLREMLNR